MSAVKKPRITEKGTLLAEGRKNASYVFEVMATANKTEIKKAIKIKYGLMPAKVNIVKLPAKMVYRRGKVGRVAAIKKAIVIMKPGEKLELA